MMLGRFINDNHKGKISTPSTPTLWFVDRSRVSTIRPKFESLKWRVHKGHVFTPPPITHPHLKIKFYSVLYLGLLIIELS